MTCFRPTMLKNSWFTFFDSWLLGAMLPLVFFGTDRIVLDERTQSLVPCLGCGFRLLDSESGAGVGY